MPSLNYQSKTLLSFLILISLSFSACKKDQPFKAIASDEVRNIRFVAPINEVQYPENLKDLDADGYNFIVIKAIDNFRSVMKNLANDAFVIPDSAMRDPNFIEADSLKHQASNKYVEHLDSSFLTTYSWYKRTNDSMNYFYRTDPGWLLAPVWSAEQMKDLSYAKVNEPERNYHARWKIDGDSIHIIHQWGDRGSNRSSYSIHIQNYGIRFFENNGNSRVWISYDSSGHGNWKKIDQDFKTTTGTW